MAKMIVVSGDLRGSEFSVEGDQVLGRLAECEISLPDRTVSRQHARLSLRSGRWHLEDLGSSTGIRGEDGSVRELFLEDGMRFHVGNVEVLFVDESGGEAVGRTGEFTEPRKPSQHPKGASGGAAFGQDLNPDAIEFKSAGAKKVGEKDLAYSNNRGRKAGVFGGDLSQMGDLGRWLMIALAIAFCVGLFWLTQSLIASS